MDMPAAPSYTPMKDMLAAVLNPYKLSEDGCSVEVDVSGVESYAQFLSKNGCSGVFVCGTTGDFSLLSLDERLQIQEAWLQPQVRALFQHVIVHIGSPVFSDMIKMGTHATQNGATAVCVTFPTFPLHAPKNKEQVIEYLAQVCALFPSTPILLYNIAGSTLPQFHNNLRPLVQGLVEKKGVTNFMGLKYTSTVFADAHEILSNTKLDVALGCDEKVLDAYSQGFKSFIGATFSFSSSALLKIVRMYDRGEKHEAEELFEDLKQIVSRLQSDGNFFHNVRVITNKYLIARGAVSLGSESKFLYLTKHDKDTAEKMADNIVRDFSAFLSL